MPTESKPAAALQRVMAMERALRAGDVNVSRIDLQLSKDLDEALAILHDRDHRLQSVIEEARKQEARARRAEALITLLQQTSSSMAESYSLRDINHANEVEIYRLARRLLLALINLSITAHDYDAANQQATAGFGPQA